jgi:hypothetical protein
METVGKLIGRPKGLPKTGGRAKGTPNKVTRDIRAALRDLAEGNSHRAQEWLDQVAVTDPAEALRLWLALLRYVTPTLQAAAIADFTPKRVSEHLTKLSDEQLLEVIVQSPQAAELVRQGVKTSDELLLRLAAPETARDQSKRNSRDKNR